MSGLLVSSIARVDSLRDPQQVVAARSVIWTAAERGCLIAIATIVECGPTGRSSAATSRPCMLVRGADLAVDELCDGRFVRVRNGH